MTLISLAWQQSSYCPEGNSCVNVAASPTSPTLHLRESDDPDVILTTTRTALRTLLNHIRTGRIPPVA
ncbi:DUF397 domain-containing protein [Streptomyces sp. NPDC051561]|uniref:DUF397 domain-containing protein n=1 Tax=Streptomyces sp. NPDC051561 TaxID=3365658 RepID=UPI0037954362